MRLATFFLVGLVAARLVQAADSPSSTAGLTFSLDQFMQQQVSAHHFSGAVLVARGGERLLAKGYGYANREWNIPNTLTTRFRLGSLTKQFTAVAVLQLREQGRLDLQDSICKYLDPCVPAWKPVTLHHLLSHTSGIPAYTGRPGSRAGQVPPWTEAEIAEYFAGRQLAFEPGSRSEYSDWAFGLLGYVIAKVTGMPYEEALRKQIFEPLGMQDSGYDHPDAVMPRRAAGYRLEGQQIVNARYTPMTAPFASGGLYSSVEDLYKWDQALYEDKLLPEKARTQMFTPTVGEYGYGWIVSRPATPTARVAPWATPGHFELVHPGSINGFSSEILRFPDDRVTIIVLANIENVSVGPALAHIVFEGEATPGFQ